MYHPTSVHMPARPTLYIRRAAAPSVSTAVSRLPREVAGPGSRSTDEASIRRRHPWRCYAGEWGSSSIRTCNCLIWLSGPPCGFRGCKNGPAPFPGWVSYTRRRNHTLTVLSLSLSLDFLSVSVVLLTRAPLLHFCVALFCVICVFSLLVVHVSFARLIAPV